MTMENPTGEFSEAELLAHTAVKLGLQNAVSHDYLRIAFENARLFDRKQSDYGPRNVSGFGTFGIIVRMTDKFERLKTLFGDGKKRRRPKNESIHDSLRDICNYSIIALLVEKGLWPKG